MSTGGILLAAGFPGLSMLLEKSSELAVRKGPGKSARFRRNVVARL